MSLPIAAELLVPHRGAMLLVDRLVEAAPDSGCVETRLPFDSVAVDAEGRVALLVCVELIAQGVAALKGHAQCNAQDSAPVGMLVGVQSFEALGEARAEQLLRIRVQAVGEFDGFTVVDGEVEGPEGLVARARIKLFVPPDGGER